MPGIVTLLYHSELLQHPWVKVFYVLVALNLLLFFELEAGSFVVQTASNSKTTKRCRKHGRSLLRHVRGALHRQRAVVCDGRCRKGILPQGQRPRATITAAHRTSLDCARQPHLAGTYPIPFGRRRRDRARQTRRVLRGRHPTTTTPHSTRENFMR